MGPVMGVPQGMTVEIGGAYEDMAESFMDIGLLALLSILLVFIVMASQFESFKMPVIIMISILLFKTNKKISLNFCQVPFPHGTELLQNFVQFNKVKAIIEKHYYFSLQSNQT